MKNTLQALAFSSLLFACGGVEPGDVADTTDAFSGNPNPCAVGTDPNYTSPTLTNVGDTYTYTRSEGWINSICVADGNDRKTTIVDFPVPSYFQHQIPETYSFTVQPTFWGSSSSGWGTAAQAQSDCINSTMATRIQRWDWTTSAWVQLTYQEQQGSWVWDNILTGRGHCKTPVFLYYRENFLNSSQTETNKYRVRTWAKQYDGSYATVWITGLHTGIY